MVFLLTHYLSRSSTWDAMFFRSKQTAKMNETAFDLVSGSTFVTSLLDPGPTLGSPKDLLGLGSSGFLPWSVVMFYFMQN